MKELGNRWKNGQDRGGGQGAEEWIEKGRRSGGGRPRAETPQQHRQDEGEGLCRKRRGTPGSRGEDLVAAGSPGRPRRHHGVVCGCRSGTEVVCSTRGHVQERRSQQARQAVFRPGPSRSGSIAPGQELKTLNYEVQGCTAVRVAVTHKVCSAQRCYPASLPPFRL